MGRRKEVALVVDVETAGFFGNCKVYDLGVAAVERTTGKIIESYSFVIHDVFFGMKRDMRTAYYKDKVPTYYAGIRSGEHIVAKFATARKRINALVQKYNVKRAYAYNAKFDRDALNNTLSIVSGGTESEFMPEGVEWCDIWHMACQSLLCQRKYRKFATENNLISDAGNYRTTAEATYAYLTDTPGVEEAHTGLADVRIETVILLAVLRLKKRVDESLVHNPWRIPQGVSV